MLKNIWFRYKEDIKLKQKHDVFIYKSQICLTETLQIGQNFHGLLKV